MTRADRPLPDSAAVSHLLAGRRSRQPASGAVLFRDRSAVGFLYMRWWERQTSPSRVENAKNRNLISIMITLAARSAALWKRSLPPGTSVIVGIFYTGIGHINRLKPCSNLRRGPTAQLGGPSHIVGKSYISITQRPILAGASFSTNAVSPMKSGRCDEPITVGTEFAFEISKGLLSRNRRTPLAGIGKGEDS
jgi:hypothetical protein